MAAGEHFQRCFSLGNGLLELGVFFFLVVDEGDEHGVQLALHGFELRGALTEHREEIAHVLEVFGLFGNGWFHLEFRRLVGWL